LTEYRKEGSKKTKAKKAAISDPTFQMLSKMDDKELEEWLARNGSDQYQMRKLIKMLIRVVSSHVVETE